MHVGLRRVGFLRFGSPFQVPHRSQEPHILRLSPVASPHCIPSLLYHQAHLKKETRSRLAKVKKSMAIDFLVPVTRRCRCQETFEEFYLARAVLQNFDGQTVDIAMS